MGNKKLGQKMNRLKFDRERLVGAMHRKGVKCAQVLGKTPHDIYYLIHRKKNVTFEDVNQICDFLKRDASDFVSIIESE